MKIEVTTPSGHLISISSSKITGQEVVTYDGQTVSEKRSLLYVSPHSFWATEEGEEVIYEVNILAGWFEHGYIVRRNGLPIAHS